MFSNVSNALWNSSKKSVNGTSRQTNTSLSASDVWKKDWEDAKIGFNYLFNDQFEEAEALLAVKAKHSPAHALGHALSAVVDSILGFEEQSIDEAMRRLQHADNLATERAKQIRRKLDSEDIPVDIASAVLAYDMLSADCTLLMSCMSFMRESVVEYAKGAYKLRNAYRMYCICHEAVCNILQSENGMVKRSSSIGKAKVNEKRRSSQNWLARRLSTPSVLSRSSSRRKSQTGTDISPTTSETNLSVSSASSSVLGSSTLTAEPEQSQDLLELIVKEAENNVDEDDASGIVDISDGLNAVSLSDATKKLGSSLAGELVIVGVNFGVGIFKLVLSMLPPRALKVLSTLGFKGDRQQGLSLLRKAVAADSELHTPFAALALLGYHTGLCTLASFTPALDTYLAEATEIIQKMRERYPNGSLWRLMEGKLYRTKANLPRALELFRHDDMLDAERKKRREQIYHLMDYEYGWCCIINGDYKQGGEIFGRLATCTNWSRAFYAYIHAACLYALGDTDRAKKVLATVPTLIRKRFGGRLIPAEQYVLRKHRQLTERSPPAHQPWPILILELVYIWNGFRQLDTKGREHVIRVLTECEKNARNADERAVALVALGCVLRENGQYASALQALNHIDEQIKDDRYAVVYSWYERSVIACYLPNDGSMTPKPGIPIGRWSEAESWLKRVTDASGYDFDNRIHLRAQLLSASIVEGRNAQTTS